MRRLEEIDVLKGLGIILMIMGHQYYGVGFDKWIHAFHMPMFFIISGFLYRRPSVIRNGICNKAKSLLIPYAFFACIHLLIMGAKTLTLGGSSKSLFLYVYHILVVNTEGMPICGAIWFLTALFFTTVIFILIDSYIHQSVLKVLCVVLFTSAGLIIPSLGYRLPLALDVSFVGIGLFFVGKMLRCIYEKVQFRGGLLIGTLGVLFCTITISINSSVNLRLGLYGNGVWFFVNAIVMTISLYLLCHTLSKYEKYIVKEISFIGKNSIVYLGFNQFILIFFKKISVDNLYIGLLIKIVSLVLCLSVLHIITNLIVNSRAKQLIGK